MNTIKALALVLLGTLTISSCEDIIELDLEQLEPRIVLEANLIASEDRVEVVASLSNGFYESAGQNLISGLDIRLIKNESEEFILSEDLDSKYGGFELGISPGDHVQLVVNEGAECYKASSTVPYPSELIRLDTMKLDLPFGPSSGGDNYQVLSTWQDIADVSNYYRLRSYTNGIYNAGTYFVTSDDNFDGDLLTRPVREAHQAGSKITMELLSIDKVYFEYFLALSSIQGEGLSSSVPFNPRGNWSNNALGYFGSYYHSTLDVQL